jgi:Uma2 family endonuclease
MASKTLLTVEHFEQLPDDGMRHELDEGELISIPPPFGAHGKVQVETVFILRSFAGPRSLGTVFTESGFRLSHDIVRAPDVSFIRAERVNTLDLERRFECAPDLAVEIISPSETAAEIAHKVRQYLHAGVEMVWVLYPRDRTIHVFESLHRARILEAEEMLEAPSLLPDFSVRVSEFFV